MAQITVQAKLTIDDLVAAIDQLEPADADRLSQHLLHIQANRRAPHLSDREADLLRRIEAEKRPGFRERYDTLIAKRQAFAMTPAEHEELLRLTDEAEAYDARRLEALAELARLRKTTLPALMQQLGLQAPSVTSITLESAISVGKLP